MGGKAREHSGKTRETEAPLQDLPAALERLETRGAALDLIAIYSTLKPRAAVSTPENRPFVFWALTKVDKRYLGKTAFPQTIVFPGPLPV